MKILTALLSQLFLACFINFSVAQTIELKFPPDPYSEDAWLDLRYLNEDIAGENGFIQLTDDGRGFVDGNGESVRFWAVNGAGSAKNLDDDALAAYARSLAKMGVNMVRYHGSLHPRGEGSNINDANKEVAEQMWRTVAAFKKEGIYSVISPFWAGMVVPSGDTPAIPESWGLGEYSGNNSPWGVMYFDDRLKDAYKNWVRYLYTTENPYTGIPLKDEPAVALIQIKNEDGLLFYTVDNIKPELRQEMEKKFFIWAGEKYGNIDLAYEAWGNTSLSKDSRQDRRLELYIIWEATQPQSGGKATRLADQVQGETVISEHRTLDAIFERDMPVIAESSGFDPNRDFWTGEDKGSGGLVPPLAFLTGPVRAVYGSDPAETYVSEEIAGLINMKEGTVTSNTGELFWDYRNGICTADSPKAQGVAGFLREMGEISLSGITVRSDNEYAVLNVVSMDNKPISESEKVLVQTGTVYQPTGWKEHVDPESNRLVIENTGTMPWRADAVSMTIKFKNNPRVTSAFLLDSNGYLKEEIPVVLSDDGLLLTVPEDAMYIILKDSK